VSEFNGKETEVCYGESTQSALAALKRAYSQIQLEQRDLAYIKVDALMAIESVPEFNYVEDSAPRQAGFAVDDWTSLVFLHDQVRGSNLVDHSGKVRWDHIGLARHKSAAGKGKLPWPLNVNYRSTTVRMDFLRTQAVLVNPDQTVVNLARGHQLFRELTPQLLQESAKMAGDYLARQTNLKEGTMVYRYQPRSDTEPEDDYNLTRHAGTAYAMAVLYKTYKSTELLKALQASLDYLVRKQLATCPLAYGSDKIARCIVDEVYRGHKWTQLGVNSLALLAMAEYTYATGDTTRYWQVCMDLATWIAGTQRRDGSLVQNQDIDSNKLDEEAYVRYFPGEAAFAMARLWNVGSALNLSVHDKWKSVASKAIDFIVRREADVDDEELQNDHWSMYSIAEMNSWHFTDGMLEFVIRTGMSAHERQIRHHDNPDDQDKDGTYLHNGKEDFQSLNSCAGATKSEGLCAVYPVVQQHAPEKAQIFLDSVLSGIHYQLKTQLRPESAMQLKVPSRAMGAFSKDIYQTETRNDYTQHNMASILCLARIMEENSFAVLRIE
jgi:hypothetical protein